MRLQNRRWRALCRSVGVLLLIAAVCAGYWWFYQMGPARRVLDRRWVAHHSQQEYWQEVQKGIHRGMWLHDDGFHVGMYGDKAWAQWIMSHVAPGTDMSCFGKPCHSATAMQYLTNQDVGQDADAWLAWWEKNKSKSQEQWLADGFRERGLKIDVPPTPEQIPTALKLLGTQKTDETAAAADYLKYNAFRCLRDSGFEPVAYALSNRAVSADAERGLLEYVQYQRRLSEPVCIGQLSVAKQADDWDDDNASELLSPAFQIKAYALIFAPLALGSALIFWSFRKKITRPQE